MKVISEINIICIEEKNKKNFVCDFIEVKKRKTPYCYYQEWGILSSIRGNWYQITPESRKFGEYPNEFFYLHTNKHKCYVVLDKEYTNIDFIKRMLLFYLNNSPINKIIFFGKITLSKKTKY